jgi:hypothetical protein
MRVFARPTTRAPLRRIQSQTNEMTHHKRTRRQPRAMRRRGTCGRARVCTCRAKRIRISDGHGTRAQVHRACKLVCERRIPCTHTRLHCSVPDGGGCAVEDVMRTFGRAERKEVGLSEEVVWYVGRRVSAEVVWYVGRRVSNGGCPSDVLTSPTAAQTRCGRN